MIWLALSFVLALLFLGTLVLSAKNSATRILGPIASAALWVVLTLFYVVHFVPTGHIGVIYRFGAISGQTGEGLALTAPIDSLREVSIQDQKWVAEKVTTFSKETQDVYMKVALQFALSPNAVQKLLREVGPNWFNVLVPSRIENFLKEETVRHETVDIAPNREKIRKVVEERLAVELAPYSISVRAFLIENIDFDKVFKDAIDAKQVASQEALKENENVAKETAKANQKIEQAKGEAQSKIENARGEAESVLVVAKAQAEANVLLSNSLTDRLVAYKTVDEWDGKLPQVTGANTPLLNIQAPTQR